MALSIGPAVDGSTKIVPGRPGLDDVRAGEVVEFLSREGGMQEDAARSWLSEIVCLAVEDETIVGVSTAHPASIALIGGRPFWLYRSVLTAAFEERWEEMFNAAFAVLAEEFSERNGAYIGLCVLVESSAEIRRRPEAVWPETELMFAGYLDDGRQVRLRYFWGAEIGPGLPNSPSLDETRRHEYPLEDRYRIHSLGETSEISAEDVIRFWEREGAMPEPDEARPRVAEVELVAVDRDGSVVGVSTLYLARNPQLRMDLWHYRTFVGEAHRMSNIAAQLIFGNRDRLEERFVSGADTRAGGMLFELEHEGMKAYFNKALWLPADFTFISENEFGDHVRIHYFPGATVPAAGDAASD
jgi:hypothetical protein